jgi:hypothetical protein
MNLCLSVRERLPSLLEGEGDIRPEMAASIYAHLAVCPGCAREFDEMQRVVALLDALPPAEIPMDFSGIIMDRIQTEMGPAQSSHPTYAVSPLSGEAAIEGDVTNSAPVPQVIQSAIVKETRTKATQATAQVGLEQQIGLHTGTRLWERLTLGGMLAAFVAFVLSTAWGREMLGVNLDTASVWLEQIGDTLRRVPVLSWIAALILSTLAQAGSLIQETYRNFGSNAARGLALDAALLAAAYYYLVVRRQRGQRLRV